MKFVVEILTVVLIWGNVYVAGLGILPFWGSSFFLKMRGHSNRVRISALDFSPCYFLGIATGPAIICVLFLDGWAFIFSILGVLFFWLSPRVRISIRPNRTIIYRTIFLVIPWFYKSYKGRPELFADGWGDWIDPEAIHLAIDTCDIELCWTSSDEQAVQIVEDYRALISKYLKKT